MTEESQALPQGPPEETAPEDTVAGEAGLAETPAPAGKRRSRGRRKRKKSSAPKPSHYWMLVSSPDNFYRTHDQRFGLQGIKSRHKKRAETMKPGDRLLYYVTGKMAFAASVTLESAVFEDHTPIWRTARKEEDYPHRIRIRPDVILEQPSWVKAKDLAFRMEYVRKWPPEHWTLAFQGHLHQLPKLDFELIEAELKRSL